jgi:hypothetical protein
MAEITETTIIRAPVLYNSTGMASLTLNASLSQSHEYSCDVTQHPVEEGIDITDHVRIKPITLTINGVVSANPLGVEAETIDAEINAWAILESMVGQVFEVDTSLRRYKNMVLRRAAVSREAGGGDGIEPQLELVEIRIVQQQTTTLPPEQVKTTPQKANAPAQKDIGGQGTKPPNAAETAAANKSLLLRLAEGAGL